MCRYLSNHTKNKVGHGLGVFYAESILAMFLHGRETTPATTHTSKAGRFVKCTGIEVQMRGGAFAQMPANQCDRKQSARISFVASKSPRDNSTYTYQHPNQDIFDH